MIQKKITIPKITTVNLVGKKGIISCIETLLMAKLLIITNFRNVRNLTCSRNYQLVVDHPSKSEMKMNVEIIKLTAENNVIKDSA